MSHREKRQRKSIQMEIDDNDLSDIETQEEPFNPLKNVQWKFLNSDITRAPSRQDLLRYPSQILTDPKYIDEDAYNFKMWKEEYMHSIDDMASHAHSNQFYQSSSTSNLERSTNPTSTTQILFIDENDEDQQQTLRSYRPPSFAPHSARTRQIPLSEEEILRQTEEYLLTLNRIEHEAKLDDRSKSADYYKKQQLAQNVYLAKRDRLNHIPSTEQLLQNVTDFEQECLSGSGLPKSRKSKTSQFDGDEWNNSRSPSPVIIWRPSSRITIAKDLPPNLRSTYDQKQSKLHDLIEQTVSCLELQDDGNMDNANILTVHDQNEEREKKKETKRVEWNSSKRSFPPRIVYGEWYVSPKKWKVRRKGECVEHTNKTDIDPQLEKQANDLKETIPDLFISKKYKLYILNQKDPNKRDLPDYLQNVDVNEKD